MQLLAAALLALSGPAAAQPGDLQAAILAGNIEVVQGLIAAGADVDEPGDLGTPLHVAALKDNVAIGRILLDHGARIEATSEPYEMRPLHVAASYGSPAVAAMLLERGAEVDPKELSGRTPLVLAVTFGHPEVAKALLAHGAHVDASDVKSGWTPLDLAILRGSRDLAELLLDRGASLDPVYINSPIPLVLAAKANQPELIELLVSRGASLAARDGSGRTALMKAKADGRLEAAASLRRLGATE